ncbi:MAG: nicotinate-nucleotide adenylyltransferase [Clostridia bacterium]|nr:nicotinate-nucleotide adenylyltransferase [Clostridia bacterium]
MRVGIMGGTFDPIHLGHTGIAEAVRSALTLDGLWFLPAGDPPHKRCVASARDRLDMALCAAEAISGAQVSDIEIRRKGTTYTVDTLKALSEAHPHCEWVYIIGADTLRILSQWKDIREVAKRCIFAVVHRPGVDATQIELALRKLERECGVKAELVEAQGPDISSTEIRSRIARGQNIDRLISPRVAEMIRQRGLYLCAMGWEEIDETLRDTLKPDRYVHTLGVAQTAKALAPVYGIDPMRAYLAGLLHDCAKSMDKEEMKRRVANEVPDTDEAELSAPQVLHAPAGMLLAKERYGVQDAEILSAIRKHTLGGANMSPLEALIYVADFIEPNRKPFEGLERVRSLAERDIALAARECARLTSEYVRKSGGTPHDKTIQLINEC